MRHFSRYSYIEIERLLEQGKKIAIFGAGFMGKGLAYNVIKAAGGRVDMFFDNFITPGTCIRDDVCVASIDEMYELSKNHEVNIILAVSYKIQEEIIKQFKEHDVEDYLIMDDIFLKYFVEDILASGNSNIIEKYKAIVNDECFLKEKYEALMNEKLNLETPGSLNEKIQWLKLYDRRGIYSIWADKYAVREYIKQNFGEQYLIPLLFKTEDVDDLIPENIGGEHFVIKTNHGSGDYKIIRDKYNTDWAKIREHFQYELEKNIYYNTREFQYKNMKPCIIVEKLLEQKNGKIPNDYKLHFFNGKCEFIYVSADREGKNYRKVYDLDWNPLNFVWSGATSLKALEGPEINKPDTLGKMLEIGSTIAKNTHYVRVDFYDVDGRLYCGEITLHHGSGYDKFFPEEVGNIYGGKLELALISNNIAGVNPYQVVKHDIWNMDEEKRHQVIKLDWNESAINPSPLVIERIQKLVANPDFFQYYPNVEHDRLISKIAAYLGVNQENVLPFPSSDSLHEYIMRSWIKKDEHVMIVWPTYDNFRLTAEVTGAKIDYCYMKDMRFNLSVIDDSISMLKPKMVYICNPNNPTGAILAAKDLLEIIKKHRNVMFLIDEAYAEFSNESIVGEAANIDNVLISRTLSKAFGLANFRIGYVVASPKNIDILSKIRNTKNISTLAQEAAITALEDIEYMKDYVLEVKKAKSMFVNFLKQYQDFIDVYDSEGNYVMVNLRSESRKTKMLEYLRNNNIYIRDLRQNVLAESFVRITIGTTKHMTRVQDVIGEFFNEKDCSI